MTEPLKATVVVLKAISARGLIDEAGSVAGLVADRLQVLRLGLGLELPEGKHRGGDEGCRPLRDEGRQRPQHGYVGRRGRHGGRVAGHEDGQGRVEIWGRVANFRHVSSQPHWPGRRRVGTGRYRGGRRGFTYASIRERVSVSRE